MTTNTLPRDTDGKLSSYAWPGGYPLYYLDGENAVLCPDCANKMETDSGWDDSQKAESVNANYEDTDCQCEQCYQYINPAYMTEAEAEAERKADADKATREYAEWLAGNK